MNRDELPGLLWSIFSTADVTQYDYQQPDITLDYSIPEYNLGVCIDVVEPDRARYDEWAWNNDWRLVHVYSRDSLATVRRDILETLNAVHILKSPGVALLPPKLTGDAGWDLVTSQDWVCPPRATTDIPSDLFMALPNHLYAVCQARSSTSRRGMLILPGVIDAGYRGQIFAMAFNPTDAQIVIKKGERVAQLLFFQRVTGLTTTVVSELRPSDRLTKGFGSSGK